MLQRTLLSGAQLPKGVPNYLSKLVSHLRENTEENCLLLDAGRGEVLIHWTKSIYPSTIGWIDEDGGGD